MLWVMFTFMLPGVGWGGMVHVNVYVHLRGRESSNGSIRIIPEYSSKMAAEQLFLS